MQRGTIYALAAYLLWGVLPIYWKQLTGVPAIETTAHRVVWSALLLGVILLVRRQWTPLRTALRSRRTFITFGATAALILTNWLVYLYAINEDQLVQTSLGYYINPLINVLLGVIFLRERPRPLQWLAIGIAAVAVGYMTIQYGHLPWIALSLATTFGFYGLIKKTTPVPALEGMLLEMAYLTIPLGGYLLVLAAAGSGAFVAAGTQTTILLTLCGVVTAAPLVLFSAGAQRVSMTVLGLLQYITPTIQFVLAVAVFREPFSLGQLIGFVLVWIALAVFTGEGIVTRRRIRLSLHRDELAQPTPPA
jgi:chloramphenicol-sensitive protein RarD